MLYFGIRNCLLFITLYYRVYAWFYFYFVDCIGPVFGMVNIIKDKNMYLNIYKYYIIFILKIIVIRDKLMFLFC
jgi:hypothetical protein